jgi:hypothetical protein
MDGDIILIVVFRLRHQSRHLRAIQPPPSHLDIRHRKKREKDHARYAVLETVQTGRKEKREEMGAC